MPASRRLASFRKGASSQTIPTIGNLASASSSRATSIKSSASFLAHSSQDLATDSDIDAIAVNKGKARAVSTPAFVKSDKDRPSQAIVESDSDGEDQAFESPDEFEDGDGPSKVLLGPRIAGSAAYATLQQPTSASGPAILGNTATDFSIPDPSETPLRADIRQIWCAVSLFLNSHMMDAEKIMLEHQKDRLYYSLGYSLITSIKALMTFEPADLGGAIEQCRGTLEFATREKNRIQPGQRGASWSERFTGSVGGMLKGSSLSVDGAERMSTEQRHAELAYAECLLL